MATTLGWQEIALRLVLTVIAGVVVGVNRTEHGRPAGLRTTLLVCLAASVSMIQANLMLDMRHKAPDSFVVLDLMRLPLGILSGMGFIGAGTILRRDNLVLGVTTAATLWFVTVIGLCLGGGQLALGMAGLALAMLALWGLRWIERQLPQDRQATLTVTLDSNSPADDVFGNSIRGAGLQILNHGITHDIAGGRRELVYDVGWHARDQSSPSSLLDELARVPGVSKLKWDPKGVPAR